MKYHYSRQGKIEEGGGVNVPPLPIYTPTEFSYYSTDFSLDTVFKIYTQINRVYFYRLPLSVLPSSVNIGYDSRDSRSGNTPPEEKYLYVFLWNRLSYLGLIPRYGTNLGYVYADREETMQLITGRVPYDYDNVRLLSMNPATYSVLTAEECFSDKSDLRVGGQKNQRIFVTFGFTTKEMPEYYDMASYDGSDHADNVGLDIDRWGNASLTEYMVNHPELWENYVINNLHSVEFYNKTGKLLITKPNHVYQGTGGNIEYYRPDDRTTVENPVKIINDNMLSNAQKHITYIDDDHFMTFNSGILLLIANFKGVSTVNLNKVTGYSFNNWYLSYSDRYPKYAPFALFGNYTYRYKAFLPSYSTVSTSDIFLGDLNTEIRFGFGELQGISRERIILY